jgi:hypothetical protein
VEVCAHVPDYPDDVPSFSDAWKKCRVNANVDGGGASTVPLDEDGTDTQTLIDAAYFRKLSDAGKTALVAHERAHAILGLRWDCECCADKVGGYLLRCWGYSPEGAAGAMHEACGAYRSGAGDAAHQGATAASSRVARRGLAGTLKTSTITTTRAAAATKKAKPSATKTAAKPNAATTNAAPTATRHGPTSATKPKPSTSPTTKATTTFFDKQFLQQVAAGVVVALVVAIAIRGKA